MHRISSLAVIDPKAAAKELLGAYVRAKANKVEAARLLGAGLRTFDRWVVQLDLAPAMEKMKDRAKREGWHHDHSQRGGRPAKAG